MAWLWPAIALVALFHCPPTEAARRYDSRDGLSENTANAIVRDELGFYWFATDTGLNRFDGRRFGAPPAPIASELEGVSIRALLVDGDALWLGTRHDGVKRIDLRRESITHLRPGDHGLPAAGITAMTLDADGRVWCATDGAGVVRIDWRDGHPEVRHYAPESSGLPHARVWSIASDGLVILAGTEVGFATLAAGASTFELQALPAPFPAQGRANIEEIVVAAPGDYWIGTWNDGLFHVRDGAVLGGGRLGPSASARVTSLILQNGEPIAGFESGVAHYQRSCDCLRPLALAETGDRVARRAFVRALAATDDGGLMVGTWFNGVFQVPPNAAVFQRLLPAHPADTELATERVEAALEDRSGHLWIGSFGAGLQRSLATVAAGPVQFEPVPIIGNTHPGANAVWVLHEDRAGRLWVGSDGGLDRLDATRTVWTHFSANIDQRGLPGPGVRDVLELDDGRTLVATSSGLAEIGRDDAIRIIDYSRPGPDEALSRTINAVRRDRLGRIWLATHAGLIVLDPSYRILRAWQRPDLPGDLVRALHLQADGVLWIGSTQLCRIDTHAETPAPPTCLGRSDGLPEDGIQGIVAGVDGALWISSLRGLRRLAPGQAEAQAFHLGSGLVSDEFGAGAAHAGASGRLYFGSPAGLQMFDPRQVVLSRQVPRPVLTEVRIGGRSIGPSDDAAQARLDAAAAYARHLYLPPGTHQVALGFSVLDARREHQNVEFRVAGLHDWLPATGDGATTYLNLPTGDFDLYLRAADATATASGERLALTLHVQPFWWERREIQFAAAALFLLLLYGAFRGRVRALHVREQRLSALVAARTREIEQQKSDLATANQQLYELSIRDGLTGVFNRRHALEEARRRLLDERSHGLCLALIDLDHFKAINDRFGHIAGDEALRSFAQALLAQSGPGDLIGRYGGEEFVCLLCDRDIDQGRHWADTLLRRVRESQIAGPNCEIRITASIGLVAIDAAAELPLEVWIARADAALYRAKAGGRDSVRVG